MVVVIIANSQTYLREWRASGKRKACVGIQVKGRRNNKIKVESQCSLFASTANGELAIYRRRLAPEQKTLECLRESKVDRAFNVFLSFSTS